MNQINTQTINTTVPLGLDLARPEVHQNAVDLFNEIIAGSPFEAAKFSERLRELLGQQKNNIFQQSPDYAGDYEEMIKKTSYYGLSFLSDAQVLDVFSKNLLEIIRAGYNIREAIRVFLSRHYSFDERNELRFRLIEAMEDNTERFGGGVAVTVGERTKAGTLGAWLGYRNSVLGQVLDTNIVSETNFITQNEALNSLSAEDKEIFTEILRLYRWLHQSSLWQSGFEDRYVLKDQSGIKILRDGALVDITEAEPIIQQLDFKKTGKPVGYELEAAKEDKIEIAAPTKIDSKDLLSEKQNELAAQQSIVEIRPIYPVPQSFKAAKPALIFDVEDEQEADKFRITNHELRIKTLEEQLRAFVDEVIKKNNLVFKDEVNQRRFVQLMVSRLKDVRGPLEIAEALRKPVETGGLGMPDEKAEQVQALVEAAKQEFESRIKNPEPRGVQGPAPDVVPGQESKPAGSPPVPGVASSGQEPGTRNEPAPRFDVEAAKAWREQMLRDLAMQGQAAATEAPAVPRPQLMDVKAPPRVVGPLEELRSLTLTDFRRLGATPPEALQKIHAKIDLLGETSLARRLEAVRAWKTSAVYQQYLKVGHESIEQGKPVSVIVGGHQTLGEQILTEEEFSSIADFNAKLRF